MPTKEAKLFNYLQTEHARLRPLAEQRDLLKRERARGRLAAVRQVMKLLNVPTRKVRSVFVGANSKIEWTDHTFNPWIGCEKVSPGCAHCYAEELMDKRYHKVKWGPQGTRVRTSVGNWREPLKWNREAEAAGERRRVFCASLADVFEDREELVPWRQELFE